MGARDGTRFLRSNAGYLAPLEFTAKILAPDAIARIIAPSAAAPARRGPAPRARCLKPEGPIGQRTADADREAQPYLLIQKLKNPRGAWKLGGG